MKTNFLFGIEAEKLAELEKIARQRSVNEGRRVSVAEILRGAAEREIKEWNDDVDR